MCNYHATVLDTYKSENDSQLFTAIGCYRLIAGGTLRF